MEEERETVMGKRAGVDLSREAAALRGGRNGESCARKAVWDLRNVDGSESGENRKRTQRRLGPTGKTCPYATLNTTTQAIDGAF